MTCFHVGVTIELNLVSLCLLALFAPTGATAVRAVAYSSISFFVS